VRLRFSRAARAELGSAARYYDERRPGLGVQFLEASDQVLVLIRDHPEIGQVLLDASPELRARHFPMPRFPYRIVYELRGEALIIHAVAHSRGEPSYWVKG
jgi:plasmid stabilization system protein ParE